MALKAKHRYDKIVYSFLIAKDESDTDLLNFIGERYKPRDFIMEVEMEATVSGYMKYGNQYSIIPNDAVIIKSFTGEVTIISSYAFALQFRILPFKDQPNDQEIYGDGSRY